MKALDEFTEKAREYYKKRESCSFDDVLRRELRAINERRGEEPTNGSDPIKDAHNENLFGLAMSGGGIRSATFNLGVLEAIARFRLLDKIDYISTVSGGGYIGAWLAAWIRRDGQDLVQSALGRTNPPENQKEDSKDEVSVDPYPITQLRRLTNYLTPKVGLFSVDTFVLIATYLRNFLLNLLIIGLASTAFVFLIRAAIKVSSALESTNLSVVYLVAIGALFAFSGFVTAKQLNRPGLVPTREVDSRSIKEDGLLYRWAHLWIILPIALGAVMFAQLNSNNIDSGLLRLFSGSFYFIFWPLLSLFILWRNVTAPAPVFTYSSKFWVLIMIATIATLTASLSYFISIELFGLFSRDTFRQFVPALGGPLVFCGVYAVIVLFIGLSGRYLTEEQRQWLSRLGAWMILYSLFWVALFLLVQFGPYLLSKEIIPRISILAIFLTIWPTMSAAGAYSGHRLEVYQEAAGVAKRIFMQAAPYVFIVGLLLFNAYLVASVFGAVDGNYSLLQDDVSWVTDVGLCAAIALLSVALSWRVDINDFSMHNFYKSRLVRAYLGASHVPRRPDPFTQFSRADDMFLSELRFKKRTPENEFEGYDGPLPIVSCALNLVGTRQLALQERKAHCFMFSPYYFGYEYQSSEPTNIGKGKRSLFRSLRKPAYRLVDSYHRQITLGESVATSGAAVSPNMGFRTTAGLAFLLTVFNVRLGAWMANPRVETKLWNYLTPKIGFTPLLNELFAQTSERTRYVYLSDGGHFENLGLYELVRRRCRYIVVSDAAADPSLSFSDLSNAIRKVRADFGIDIDIDVSEIAIGDDGLSKSHYAVGLIHYDQAYENEQPGFLIYIKASLTGREPSDIAGYKKEHPSFPHQSTADQWFTESQFGSYRVLGRHIAQSVFRTCGKREIDDMSLEEFFSHLRRASYPASTKIQESFTGHAAKLQSLLADLSNETDLHFLDQQLFPDSYRFRGDIELSDSGIPTDPDQFRKGFYFCSRLIQLMENVFIDLNLDREYAHPDNRGWLNLFNHWTSANMLRLTWALSASTYGSRFQKFCEDHFEMRLGSIEAIETKLGDRGLEEFTKDAFRENIITGRERRRLEKIAKLVRERGVEIDSFWEFKVQINIEAASSDAPLGEYKLPCGFAINDSNDRLVFLRIRDHLRGLGLARPILYELSRRQVKPVRMSPEARRIYDAIVRYPQRGRYFEILLHSLRGMRLARGSGSSDEEV